MQPIRKNILFKPFPSEEKTEGGLFVSEAHRPVSNKGTIVATGNLCKKTATGQIGYRVKDWGTEVLIEGEKHFLMNEDAVLAFDKP